MIDVAKIGRTVGINGDLKLYILSDFPQIFQQDIDFFLLKSGLNRSLIPLKIKTYIKGLVCFEGYETLEKAKTLTNGILRMRIEDTRRFCHLEQDEFFWFDLLGFEIVEDNQCIGIVKDIERIANTDYLLIEARGEDNKRSKRFMIPYIKRYIVQTLFERKQILTQGAKEIWFAS